MENTTSLTLIGYWHSFYQPDLPDPAWFIDKNWKKEEREKISHYLKSWPHPGFAAGGTSWCRFRCVNHGLGSTEYTDGKYCWPEGLSHYIDHHHVRLPDEVVSHMLSKEITTKLPAIKNVYVDMSWWEKQKGWNRENKSYNDPQDIGILTITQTRAVFIDKQANFLNANLPGIRGRAALIEKIITGKPADIKGRFDAIDSFLQQLPSGLHGSFRYCTREEYEQSSLAS